VGLTWAAHYHKPAALQPFHIFKVLMQIILMHSRFTQAKSVTLSSHHIVLAVLGFMLLTLLTVC
jgi:hypothetical protein